MRITPTSHNHAHHLVHYLHIGALQMNQNYIVSNIEVSAYHNYASSLSFCAGPNPASPPDTILKQIHPHRPRTSPSDYWLISRIMITWRNTARPITGQ